MSAYLAAAWSGQVDGPAFWLLVAAAGLVLGGLIAAALCWLADWTFRNWPGDLDDPSIFCADETRVPKE